MDLQIDNKEFHTGPGSIALEFTHFRFKRNLEEISEGLVNFPQVLKSLQYSRYFKVGYQPDQERYGPFLKRSIKPTLFEKIDAAHIPNKTADFLREVAKQQNFRFDDIAFFVEKLEFNLRYVPVDQTEFYLFTPSFSIKPDSTNGDLIEEPTLFDYFYSIIGFNDQKVYLISIWYD